MKSCTILLTALAAAAFTLSPLSLHAQDQPPPPPDQSGGAPPPPPMDQGAPPPPDQQGAPPPPDGQGGPPPDQGGGDSGGASFDQFYNGLSSQGQWVQTPDYGYAFQPNVQDPNWAPYTDGHWVYTDYGWTWASDEPWGWATYHYGRWVNVVGTGWMWVPGYQWAPAWVSWRYGGGYCGWAPLPPSTFVGVEFGGPGVNLNFGFHFGPDVDVNFGIGPGCYNFIPIGYIGDPYYRGHYYDRSRNFVIINNTRNITNITVNRGNRGAFGNVMAGGPDFARVNGLSHTPVQHVRLAEAGQAGRSTNLGRNDERLRAAHQPGHAAAGASDGSRAFALERGDQSWHVGCRSRCRSTRASVPPRLPRRPFARQRKPRPVRRRASPPSVAWLRRHPPPPSRASACRMRSGNKRRPSSAPRLRSITRRAVRSMERTRRVSTNRP